MHDKLDDFVSIINKHLQPVFMQIRKGTDENDGKKYYALVSKVFFSPPSMKQIKNNLSVMATNFTRSECCNLKGYHE